MSEIIFVAEQLGRIANALDRLATVEEKKFLKAYPQKEFKIGEISRPTDELREQYSDKADDKWLAETEAALPKSRFQERFEAASTGNGKSDAAKAAGSPEVGSKPRAARSIPKTK